MNVCTYANVSNLSLCVRMCLCVTVHVCTYVFMRMGEETSKSMEVHTNAHTMYTHNIRFIIATTATAVVVTEVVR